MAASPALSTVEPVRTSASAQDGPPAGPQAGSVLPPGPRDPYDSTPGLFRALVALPAEDPRREELRAEIVDLYLPLARGLAGRFRNRGEAQDDLIQAASLGLVKAVNGFDPDRGVEFPAYAVPTIVGEVKRHFRDRGWMIRVPRRVQETRLALTAAGADLSQELGRAPTVAELALRVQASEEDVLEAIDADHAYSTLSLDAPGYDGETPMGDNLAGDTEDASGVVDKVALEPMLAALPDRERRILLLRFYGDMSQSQIAADVGLSQMHVSRLLSRTLATLRTQLLAE